MDIIEVSFIYFFNIYKMVVGIWVILLGNVF